MSDIRAAGRDVTNVRQVVSKWNQQIITVDDQTFNPEWHEEIQGVSRDAATAAIQAAILAGNVNP